MTRFFAVLISLIGLTLPAGAGQLSIAQIEAAWGSVSNLSGTFVQQHEDGAPLTGTYYVVDATLIIMTYDAQSAIVIMNGTENGRKIALPDGRTLQVAGRQIAVIDPGFETSSQPLGVFSRLLDKQPQIEQLVTGDGSSPQLTAVRLRHPQAHNRGYVDLSFDNATKLLRKWESYIDGQQVVTVFY